MAQSPKPSRILPAATDISYLVYGVRLFNIYLLTLAVVMFKMRLLSFFSSIKKFEKLGLPRYLGSNQDSVALLDVMSVTVRFVGLSGNATSKTKYKIGNQMCNNRQKHQMVKGR